MQERKIFVQADRRLRRLIRADTIRVLIMFTKYAVNGVLKLPLCVHSPHQLSEGYLVVSVEVCVVCGQKSLDHRSEMTGSISFVCNFTRLGRH